MEFEFQVLLFSTLYDYANTGVTALMQISDNENEKTITKTITI